MPFLLPGMHERYFFPADVLAVVYAMQVRMGWHVAALMQCASLGSYSPFLTGTEPIPLSWLAVLPVVALIEVVATVLMGSARELARTPGQDVAGSPCRPGSSKAASVP